MLFHTCYREIKPLTVIIVKSICIILYKAMVSLLFLLIFIDTQKISTLKPRIEFQIGISLFFILLLKILQHYKIHFLKIMQIPQRNIMTLIDNDLLAEKINLFEGEFSEYLKYTKLYFSSYYSYTI